MRRILFTLSFLMIIPALVFGTERRLALVIGNGNYENAAILANPVNDANSVSLTLGQLGFQVLKFENLNQVDMKRAIDEFGEKLKQYDIGLFYYAGHGIQINGNNFLVPVDASVKSENEADYECINAERILAKIDASGVKTSIIILDACRNNPFSRSWSRGIKRDGLAFVEAAVGSVIAYSTSPGNYASDGVGKNSLYTQCFLECIGDPELNIMQVFQKVRKLVREKSGGDQIPWESTSLEGDFFFNQTGMKLLSGSQLLSDSNELKDYSEIEQKRRINEIKSSDGTLWAEGKGSTVEEADLRSKQSFKSTISQYLSSNPQNRSLKRAQPESSTDKDGYELFIEELQSFTSRKIYSKNNSKVALRYIPTKEIGNLISLKAEKVKRLIESAQNAEKEFKTGDALRYYYWAKSLAQIYPIGEDAMKRIIDFQPQDKNPEDFFNNKIQNLLSSLSCIYTDSVMYDGMKRAEVKFLQGDHIIENIEFRYWNGISWSNENSVNNEIGFVDIYPEQSIRDLKIEIVYNNPNKAKFDKELERAVQITDSRKFNSLCPVSRVLKASSATVNNPEINLNEYVGKIMDVIKSVERKDNSFNETLFTSNGFQVYKALLLYGNATFLSIDNNLSCISNGASTYVRGIPVKFRFRNNPVEFFEKLSFQFDSAKKINNISFTLSNVSIRDILGQSKWSDNSKFQIISFLENYKTAYALKRYDYLNKIFSDNALIIVGERVEESTKLDDNRYKFSGAKYVLTRLTKEQYMYRLKKVFEMNDFINIQFEESSVKKRDNASEVYGINIKQNYFSSVYADKGYLFLMVDLKDNTRPVIYVRSWQPEKMDNEYKISLADFSN